MEVLDSWTELVLQNNPRLIGTKDSWGSLPSCSDVRQAHRGRNESTTGPDEFSTTYVVLSRVRPCTVLVHKRSHDCERGTPRVCATSL